MVVIGLIEVGVSGIVVILRQCCAVCRVELSNLLPRAVVRLIAVVLEVLHCHSIVLWNFPLVIPQVDIQIDVAILLDAWREAVHLVVHVKCLARILHLRHAIHKVPVAVEILRCTRSIGVVASDILCLIDCRLEAPRHIVAIDLHYGISARCSARAVLICPQLARRTRHGVYLDILELRVSRIVVVECHVGMSSPSVYLLVLGEECAVVCAVLGVCAGRIITQGLGLEHRRVSSDHNGRILIHELHIVLQPLPLYISQTIRIATL